MVEAEEDSSGYIYSGVRANVLGEFELKHIKDAMVSIYVSADRDYKIYEGIEVNQRDLVLTLTPTEWGPEPTPEEQARRKAQQAYDENAEERFKTLVSQPARSWRFRSGCPVRPSPLEIWRARRSPCISGTTWRLLIEFTGAPAKSLAGGVWRKRVRLCCCLSRRNRN